MFHTWYSPLAMPNSALENAGHRSLSSPVNYWGGAQDKFRSNEGPGG